MMDFLRNRLSYVQFKRGIAHLLNPDTQVVHINNFSSAAEFERIARLLHTFGWPDQDKWWLWREQLRKEYRIFPSFSAQFLSKLEEYNALSILEAPWFARPLSDAVQEEGSQIVEITSTREARRLTDTPETLRIGRLLSNPDVGVNLSETQIRDLVNCYQLGAFEVRFARTADEIIHVYEHGPSSCMVMRGASRNWPRDKHPVQAYESPDLAVAYLIRNGDDDNVVARSVINMVTNTAIRFYGDPKLQTMLEARGVNVQNTGTPGDFRQTLSNVRFKRIEGPEGGIYFPYLDNNYRAVTLFDDEGNDEEYLKIITGSREDFNPSARQGHRGAPIAWNTGNTSGFSALLFDDRAYLRRHRSSAESSEGLRQLCGQYPLGLLIVATILNRGIDVTPGSNFRTSIEIMSHDDIVLGLIDKYLVMYAMRLLKDSYLEAKQTFSVRMFNYADPRNSAIEDREFVLLPMPYSVLHQHTIPFIKFNGRIPMFPHMIPNELTEGEDLEDAMGRNHRLFSDYVTSLYQSDMLVKGVVPYSVFPQASSDPNAMFMETDYSLNRMQIRSVSPRSLSANTRHIRSMSMYRWARSFLDEWGLLEDHGDQVNLVLVENSLEEPITSIQRFHIHTALITALTCFLWDRPQSQTIHNMISGFKMPSTLLKFERTQTSTVLPAQVVRTRIRTDGFDFFYQNQEMM